MHQSPITLMEGDGAEGDSKPLAEEGGVDGEVQVELSQQPPQLGEEVEMAPACDPICDKELQSVEDSTCLKSVLVGYKEKTTDGYNWRKYGQKQVKNPEGSRGYYRCTFSNCSAKKIEYFDRSHRVTYIVYKTHHSHDPSEKVHCDIEHNRPSPSMHENGIGDITRPVSCSKEPSPKNDCIIETKQHDLSGPDETMDSEVEIAEVRKDETMEKRSLDSEMGSLPENGKTRKFIFRETIADASIRGDGYKWRKYGQKTVKGKPHPRNYYKCTSSGCPVRKHIEKATDNTCSVIVTYKGVHDHDLPVPKKR